MPLDRASIRVNVSMNNKSTLANRNTDPINRAVTNTSSIILNVETNLARSARYFNLYFVAAKTQNDFARYLLAATVMMTVEKV